MSPLVRKEARMLLPGWLAAMGAAGLSFSPSRPWAGLCAYVAVAAVLLLVLSPFGKETTYGTFGLMLVQPEQRLRWWRTKVTLLAVALASAWVVFIFAARRWVPETEQTDFILTSALVTLLSFSGGLWTTLLFRDVVSALFGTCLVPFLLWGGTLMATSHWANADSAVPAITAVAVLAVYAVAGYWWARKLFLTAEDLAWTGGQFSLQLGQRKSLRWLAFACGAGQSRWTSLAQKELQLQEVTMVLIPLLVGLHLVLLAVHHFEPHWLASVGDFLGEAVPYIWVGVVPAIIGCVAVAEERRLNTLEGLLCLPVSQRASFALKLVVSLLLGTLLGGCIPWLLLRAAAPKMPEYSLAEAMALAAGVTLLGFYASTMSRGLLQALPTLLGIIIPFGIGYDIYWSQIMFPRILFGRIGLSSVYPAIIVPVALAAFIWLSWRNYRQLQTGWPLWQDNAIRAGMVVVSAAFLAVAIYDRDWEWFMRLEPVHGPARISGNGHSSVGTWGPFPWTLRTTSAKGKPTQSVVSGIYALLPDGRLWLGQVNRSLDTGGEGAFENAATSVSGEFSTRSNWVQIATSGRNGPVGLQSDGTLWRIDPDSLIQIGTDSDWKEVGGTGGGYMALKTNGTLWGWGGMEAILRQEHNVTTNNPSLKQIGTDSNWVHIFVMKYQEAFGVRNDGTVWKWGQPNSEPGLVRPIRKDGDLESYKWDLTGTNWTSMLSAWNFTLGVRDDGTLWASGYLAERIFGTRLEAGRHRQEVRIGDKSDWVSLSGGAGELTGLEANGTFSIMQVNGSLTKRPSRYSDWLAAGQEFGRTWGLAKDGTLSCWDPFRVNAPPNDINGSSPTFRQSFYLGPTRRPLCSYNILDGK